MKFRIRFKKNDLCLHTFVTVLNDSVKALLIAWNSKAFALAGRVEPTCETSVNHVFLKENLFLSKSTAKEEVCTVGLFEDRL